MKVLKEASFPPLFYLCQISLYNVYGYGIVCHKKQCLEERKLMSQALKYEDQSLEDRIEFLDLHPDLLKIQKEKNDTLEPEELEWIKDYPTVSISSGGNGGLFLLARGNIMKSLLQEAVNKGKEGIAEAKRGLMKLHFRYGRPEYNGKSLVPVLKKEPKNLLQKIAMRFNHMVSGEKKESTHVFGISRNGGLPPVIFDNSDVSDAFKEEYDELIYRQEMNNHTHRLANFLHANDTAQRYGSAYAKASSRTPETLINNHRKNTRPEHHNTFR